MGLIRLVIFAVVIWLIWRMVKNFNAKLASQGKRKDKLENQNMVACRYCSVHVPEKEALNHDDDWFCSEAHKQKFLDDNS